MKLLRWELYEAELTILEPNEELYDELDKFLWKSSVSLKLVMDAELFIMWLFGSVTETVGKFDEDSE